MRRCTVLLLLFAALLIAGCTSEVPSGTHLSWTYSVDQLEKASMEIGKKVSTEETRSLSRLISSMYAGCKVHADCVATTLEGSTVGKDEIGQVKFRFKNQEGVQISESTTAIPDERFPLEALLRVNKDIGVTTP